MMACTQSALSLRILLPSQRFSQQRACGDGGGGFRRMMRRRCPFSSSSSSSSSSQSSSPNGDPAPGELPPIDTSRRHTGIVMHPDSIGRLILPGDVVFKQTLAGKKRWQPVALEYGYFWMLRDLRQTDERPIQSTDTLIPEAEAKVFPQITGVTCLAARASNNNDENSNITLPDHWLRHNRSRDPAAQVTVLGLAFRDYGSQMLHDWLTPLQQQHTNSNQFTYPDRVETVRLHLTEGYVSKYLLQPLVTASMRRNTPTAELPSTYIHFAADLNATVRDPIRAHNLMTAYVYLLDGLGRVRWAASGPASDEEVTRLRGLIQEILRPTLPPPSPSKKKKRGGR